MKKMQGAMLLLVSLLMGYSATLHAEDTDIYVDNAASSGLPNVLLVMDNGADFSANAKIGCTSYTGTNPPEAPSLGTTTGAGIEQCALVDAINALPDGAVNIGLLVSNANNFAASSPGGDQPAWHELCTSDYGGCLLRRLTKMDAAGKASLISFIKSWKSSGNNSATQFNVKVNTALPATMMQEAWAYYHGKVGMSGKDYGTSIVGAGCQKNFIIYVANGEKSPADESNPSPFDALKADQVHATDAQKAKITQTVVFKEPNSPTCGAKSVPATSSNSDWSQNWADEWARLMYGQDGSATFEGLQSITTYTIAVVNETLNGDKTVCTPDYPALMASMADFGGGKYFKTGTAADIALALTKILNEVQAVNSVFSSASLPVSVNAEGSYLNQIYLGMFRPDASGSPRWMGNLKQYQLIRSGTTLILGDASTPPAGAISSAGTGFISPNAKSFWTIRDDTKIPDSMGGFFKNVPADQRGTLKSPYDSPDGEVVEKGGVAQQLRLENLTSTFTGATDPSANPRRLYTYCPAGGACTSALTNARNQFSTANADIAANAFGAVDRDTVIKWLRGQDNHGDETGPGGTVTVRGSVHGDVLHSRPLVVNYGDGRIVVFYGSNDGIYRAVNGNQTAAIGSVPAGGELWGLVLPEHFNKINRQRVASPELKFPSTTDPSARPKDYFVDGATGAFQKLGLDGTTIDKAYLFLTMRRGGRFMYGLDVSDPAAPAVLWRIDSTTPGFEELGQTWSRPRVTLLQGGGLGTTPILVFAAGYDPAEDSQPPGADTMGRGIYALNARTGALIWSATKTGTCATGATCLAVPGLTHAIPSDVAFVDRDGNGYIDKLYFGDMGGNIWRADVSAAATTDWTVTKLAALGCGVAGDPSPCPAPRKFFFPPSVLTVRAAGAQDSFDAISAASGDREHPLKIVTSGSSYNVKDKFFMIMDRATSVPPGTLTANITGGTLVDASTTPYDGSGNGFYLGFNTGEKAVNAPTAVNGQIYFATNRPIERVNSCVGNLGEAKAYAVSPFLGTQTSSVLPGGGLPPSAVSGVIIIGSTNPDGTPGPSTQEKFCIGCGVAPPEKPPCPALENCSPDANIPKDLRRTYWYKK